MSATWLIAGAGLMLCAFALQLCDHLFDPDIAVKARPVATFSMLYVLACAGWAWLVLQLPRQETPRPGVLLGFIFTIGLGARLLMFGTLPIQEIDFYRYLWDGAVTAGGFNPWAHSPENIASAAAGTEHLQALAASGRETLNQINYGHLTTIYPALAQGVFGLVHLIEPFSLNALRAVLILIETGVFVLLCLALHHLGRPLHWVAAYWWCPIAIKEIANSAHMEPVLLLPLVAGVLFAMQSRPMLATLALALAAAAKVWPILLLPVVWRPLLGSPAKLVACIAIAAATLVLAYAPMLAAGLGEGAGLSAFASGWERISLPFLVILKFAELLPENLANPELTARLITGLLVAGVVAFVSMRPAHDAGETACKMLIISAAVMLLSPVQLPWYFLWVLPFVCIHPNRATLLAGVMFPLYYAFYALTARPIDEIWLQALVWAMWLPVWVAVGWTIWRAFAPRSRLAAHTETGNA